MNEIVQSRLEDLRLLLESLEVLFGRRVDLLEPGPIVNPYLRRSIEESRRVLYETAA